MPEPVPLGAPRFGEAAPTEKPIERRGSYGMWGGLAAAAVIFLGVAVAMRSVSDESATPSVLLATWRMRRSSLTMNVLNHFPISPNSSPVP